MRSAVDLHSLERKSYGKYRVGFIHLASMYPDHGITEREAEHPHVSTSYKGQYYAGRVISSHVLSGRLAGPRRAEWLSLSFASRVSPLNNGLISLISIRWRW